MSKQNDKIMERFRKRQQDRMEKDRQRYGRDFKPEVEGSEPDRR